MPNVNDEVVRRIKAHLANHYDPNYEYCIDHWEELDSDDHFANGWASGVNNQQEIILNIVRDVEKEFAIGKD